MFPLHPAHLRNFDYTGFYRYFLTWCCRERQPLFEQEDAVDLVRTQFLRAGQACDMAVLSYCFMPDHVHLLVEGVRPSADGRRFFRLAKQYSGFEYSGRFNRRLWQRYGHEHVLRGEESSRRVTRYILENPVRAGLAATVRDWPFVGSGVRSRAELIEWAYLDDDKWSG